MVHLSLPHVNTFARGKALNLPDVDLPDVRAILSVPPHSDVRTMGLAVVGGFTPRQCGIATFTTDLVEKLEQYHPEIAVDMYVLDDPKKPLEYEGVNGIITSNDPASFAAIAQQINRSRVDAVWLQHEYGIFGGDDGDMVLDFVDQLAPPLVLTLHTVLADPSPRQRAILHHLVTRASRIMVMSASSRAILEETYGVAPALIDVIDHGAPDRPFGRQDLFKARMGLQGRKVLMTFGLLGQGKGLEHSIAALPAIVERHPDVIYRIVGATHPNLLASEGEAYRESLIAQAQKLGVADHVAWDNRFLDTNELLDQLEACDIYLTPYPGLQQSTSGTLSYAVALGKALVSTPYVHARELLAGGVGQLIKPHSSEDIARCVNALLDHPDEMLAMQKRAYARGRETIWPRFADAVASLAFRALPEEAHVPPLGLRPEMSAVWAMSDGTGILQHSRGVVPDRRHGYCLDDNARALMLMNKATHVPAGEHMRWSVIYASFVQSAWNSEKGRFRNFMRFDRTWCEDNGSDDANGRAVWALGHTYENAPDEGLRDWALNIYEEVIRDLAPMHSLRASAFQMLGACAVLRQDPHHAPSRAIVEQGAAFLMESLHAARRPDWHWFESVLAYDNPRLPQALIEAGMILGHEVWIGAGLETLQWLCAKQTAVTGHFRPIGSESFHKAYGTRPFDQQPLEAQAAIEAALSAWRATHGSYWQEHAMAAWRWFFGGNDRGAVLADMATGRCRDGVTPRGGNLNCGAESVLAFQLAYYALISGLNDAS